MHRDTAVEANTEIPPEEVAEIRERLVKKLQRLKARDAADAADAAREAAEGGAGEDAVEETGGGETQDADTR